MRANTTVLLLLCACVCFAGDPSVTWQINVANGETEYVYTLVNGSAYRITAFWLNMPEGGAASVTSFTGGPVNWYSGASFHGRGDLSFWGMFGDVSCAIEPGTQAVFRLTTDDSVPTVYGFAPPGKTSNWTWLYSTGTGDGIGSGTGQLPVPAAEPSATFALASGLGALMLRRRRR